MKLNLMKKMGRNELCFFVCMCVCVALTSVGFFLSFFYKACKTSQRPPICVFAVVGGVKCYLSFMLSFFFYSLVLIQ